MDMEQTYLKTLGHSVSSPRARLSVLKGKSFLILLFLILTSFSVQAQQKVSGTVTDDSGGALPGVTVYAKGTDVGIATDIDGKFVLNVPQGIDVLTFSFVGMLSQDIAIGSRTVIDVTMVYDAIGIEEVVAVGYGTQTKKTLTGAVASVEADELNVVPTANAASRLQGRVAGVTIVNDNSPGGDAQVRVRGYSTINSNDPLYIIDGVPTTGGLSQINPNDIENMTVLKDASSTAIYGVRAANGVIIITTKRGKKGAPKISFNARYGVQKHTNSYDLLNTQEYGELLWLQNRNAGLSVGDAGWGNQQYGYGADPVIPTYCKPAGTNTIDETTYSYPNNTIYRASQEGTDWLEELLESAPIQEYDFSVTGGTEKANFAFTGGYMNQEGIVMNTSFDRYSARLNADAQLKDWLKVGESLGVTYTNRKGAFDNNDEGNQVSMAYRMQPIIPVYDIAGNWAGTKAPATGNGKNPVAESFRDKDDYDRQTRVLGNVFAELTFTEGLTFKTLLGMDLSHRRRMDRDLMDPEFSEATTSDKLTQRYNGGWQYNWSNTLNYNTSYEDHNLNVLLGAEAVNNYYEFMTAGRSTYYSTDIDYMQLDSGEADQSSSGSFDEWKTFSYFGRLNYDYAGRYLLEAVVRRDASSKFSESNRWGTFPAFSAGWRISEESFMEGTRNWLDDLKLRGGWGQNGNDQMGLYNQYSTYRANIDESSYSLTGSNTVSTAGFHRYLQGNPDAKWETTTTTNLGLDLVAFNNALEVNVDWYTRTTTDMLVNQPKSATNGDLEFPAINLGEMKNTGIDFMATYRNSIGKDLRYTVRANISHYKNELTKLSGNPDEILFGPLLRQNIYTAGKPGEAMSSFYGYIHDGFFNSQAEVDAHVPYGNEDRALDSYSQPGVLKYRDVSGDGYISPDDRTFIGSPHPDFTYGINLDIEYKNFDVAMFFQGSSGNELVNYVNRWILFNNFQGNRSVDRLYESWTAERYQNGSTITVPIALAEDTQMQKNSTYFVEDASYFRMKNLQVGYTLPSSLMDKWGVDRVRVYFQATNLFTITDYSGLDPEIHETDQNDFGVDQGIYPTSRMFMFGVNLNL